MGASVGAAGGGGGGKRRSRSNRKGLNADINVTPLVDVMLVLLIVFMVAAPLMTVSVPVDLPKTAATPVPNPTKPLFVTVQADKSVYLMEEQMPMNALLEKLGAIAKDGLNENIQVRADASLPYGTIMEVLGLLNGAGYTKVGLATLPLDAKPAGEGN
jgi:biopolymer transport protein TolR